MSIAIIGYRDLCECSHEELVTGLASSEVQLTRIFLKKATSLQGWVWRPPVWSERLGPSGLPSPLVTSLLHIYRILLFDQWCHDLWCLSFWLREGKQESHTTLIVVPFLWIGCGGWCLGVFQYPVARRRIGVWLCLIVSQGWWPLMRLFALRILVNLYLQSWIDSPGLGILSVGATVEQFCVLNPISKGDSRLPVLIQPEDGSRIYPSHNVFGDGVRSLRSGRGVWCRIGAVGAGASQRGAFGVGVGITWWVASPNRACLRKRGTGALGYLFYAYWATSGASDFSFFRMWRKKWD